MKNRFYDHVCLRNNFASPPILPLLKTATIEKLQQLRQRKLRPNLVNLPIAIMGDAS
jgi:hypothetical protein